VFHTSEGTGDDRGAEGDERERACSVSKEEDRRGRKREEPGVHAREDHGAEQRAEAEKMNGRGSSVAAHHALERADEDEKEQREERGLEAVRPLEVEHEERMQRAHRGERGTPLPRPRPHDCVHRRRHERREEEPQSRRDAHPHSRILRHPEDRDEHPAPERVVTVRDVEPVERAPRARREVLRDLQVVERIVVEEVCQARLGTEDQDRAFDQDRGGSEQGEGRCETPPHRAVFVFSASSCGKPRTTVRRWISSVSSSPRMRTSCFPSGRISAWKTFSFLES
jgi:hypothetical protein